MRALKVLMLRCSLLLGFVAGVLAGVALCCLWLLAAKDQEDD